MTTPEHEPSGAARAPEPPRGARGWCLPLTIAGLGLLVAVPILVPRFSFSVVPPFPELLRPAGVVDGTVEVGPAERSVEVEVTLPNAARVAAAAGDDTVYLEIDLADQPGDRSIELEIFRRDEPGAVLRRIAIEPGADARWTLVCDPTGTSCAATYEVVFASDPSAEPVTIGWRISAEVRPPRGAEVEADAEIIVRLVPAP